MPQPYPADWVRGPIFTYGLIVADPVADVTPDAAVETCIVKVSKVFDKTSNVLSVNTVVA